MTLKSNDAENSALRHRSTHFCNLSLDSVFFIPELKLVDRVWLQELRHHWQGLQEHSGGRLDVPQLLLLLCTSRLVSIGGCGCEEFQLCLTVHSLTHRADTKMYWHIFIWECNYVKQATYTQVVEESEMLIQANQMLGTMRAFQSAVNTKIKRCTFN